MSVRILNALEARPILPLLTPLAATTALPAARALEGGGIKVVEIAQRTDAALDALRTVAEQAPELCVGAGTVLSADQALACIDAGAGFIVSPGLDEAVIEAARSRNVDVVPGIQTPTELQRAHRLGLVLVVMGGILGGIFTATEAGAIAVLYSLGLAIFAYRDITFRDLYPILQRSAETTAIVMFLIAASVAMSWLLAYLDIPSELAELLLSLSDNPVVLLFIVNLILLAVGAFMDMTPAVLIFTPFLLPVASDLGMSPLHFGIMMVLNLSIGLCTPPVGSILFLSCAVAKTTISQMIRPLIPMVAAMIVALMLVTYVPALSEWLPRSLGLLE